MTPRPAARYDLLPRPHNVAAIAVLCAVGWAGLVWHAVGRRAWEPTAAPADPDRVAAARETIDPNTASLASLRRLPGIGPALAERIVEFRAGKGRPFRTPEDLAQIERIGPATVERLRQHLALPGGAGRQ
jgi:competence ComEA-like helix-hairpin-helix protein